MFPKVKFLAILMTDSHCFNKLTSAYQKWILLFNPFFRCEKENNQKYDTYINVLLVNLRRVSILNNYDVLGLQFRRLHVLWHGTMVATDCRLKIQNYGAHFRINWFSKYSFRTLEKKSDFVVVVRKKVLRSNSCKSKGSLSLPHHLDTCNSWLLHQRVRLLRDRLEPEQNKTTKKISKLHVANLTF